MEFDDTEPNPVARRREDHAGMSPVWEAGGERPERNGGWGNRRVDALEVVEAGGVGWQGM